MLLCACQYLLLWPKQVPPERHLRRLQFLRCDGTKLNQRRQGTASPRLAHPDPSGQSQKSSFTSAICTCKQTTQTDKTRS